MRECTHTQGSLINTEKRFIYKTNNGITLVALVITIIVMLLLSVVSINLIQNLGLIEKVKLAKEEHRASTIQEQKELFEKEIEISKYEGSTPKTINDLLDKLEEEKLITEEEKNTIKETGRVTIGSKKIIFDTIILPEGYTRCEYLESTGTQCIDTEFVPKINAKLEMELKFDGDFQAIEGNANVFGVRDTQSVFSLNFGEGARQKNILFCWCEYISKDGNRIRSLTITDDIRLNRNKIVFQSEKIIYENLSANMATRNSENDDSLAIFGTKRNGVYYPFKAYNMYLYSCKLYNGEELERNLIPCLDINDTPCMYDTVSGKTFYNQGTGEFIAGPVVE